MTVRTYDDAPTVREWVARTDTDTIRDAILPDIMVLIRAEINHADRDRQETEDHQNRLLNRNRLYVLVFMWLASIVVPVLALRVLHVPVLAFFAGSVGYTGAFVLTFWSWLRRY